MGTQLYTVRSLTQRDLPGVLAEIRRIGCEEVETYWDAYSHPATELKRMIEDHGLRVPGGHFDYDGLEGKLDYAPTLGVQFIAGAPNEDWMNWRRVIISIPDKILFQKIHKRERDYWVPRTTRRSEAVGACWIGSAEHTPPPRERIP